MRKLVVVKQVAESARVVSAVPKLEDMRSLSRAKKELSGALALTISVCMELGKLRQNKNRTLDQDKKMADLRRERTLRIGVLSGELANIATILRREPEYLEALEALKLIRRHPSLGIRAGATAMLELATMLSEHSVLSGSRCHFQSVISDCSVVIADRDIPKSGPLRSGF